MSKVTVNGIVKNLENEGRTLIETELKTNPNLSEAEAVKVVESGVDALLVHASPLGVIAEPFVNYFIEADVPKLYEAAVKDLLGTQAGGGVIAGQSAS